MTDDIGKTLSGWWREAPHEGLSERTRALLASGQIQMRKVDGWETLSQSLEPMPLDLAA